MSVSVQATGGVSQAAWTGASMRMPPTQKMNALFSRIDTAGTGSISKPQFTQAFQTQHPPRPFRQLGADAVWSRLDPGGSGQVGRSAFVQGMTTMMSQLRQSTGAASSAAATSPSSTVAAAQGGLSAWPGPGGRVDLSA